MINDNEIVIIDKEVLRNCQELYDQIQLSNYKIEQLNDQNQKVMTQNIEVLKQYDKLIDYQISKNTFLILFLSVIANFLLNKFFITGKIDFIALRNSLKKK